MEMVHISAHQATVFFSIKGELKKMSMQVFPDYLKKNNLSDTL
jgi:hypothetical protein